MDVELKRKKNKFDYNNGFRNGKIIMPIKSLKERPRLDLEFLNNKTKTKVDKNNQNVMIEKTNDRIEEQVDSEEKNLNHQNNSNYGCWRNGKIVMPRNLLIERPRLEI